MVMNPRQDKPIRGTLVLIKDVGGTSSSSLGELGPRFFLESFNPGKMFGRLRAPSAIVGQRQEARRSAGARDAEPELSSLRHRSPTTTRARFHIFYPFGDSIINSLQSTCLLFKVLNKVPNKWSYEPLQSRVLEEPRSATIGSTKRRW